MMSENQNKEDIKFKTFFNPVNNKKDKMNKYLR